MFLFLFLLLILFSPQTLLGIHDSFLPLLVLVAIYAKAGGCTLEEKALVASTLLDPPNIVGYLIVDDDRRGRKKKKKGPSLTSFFQGGGELDYDQEEEEDDSIIDDFIENPFWAEVGDTDEDLGSLWEELMVQVQKQPRLPFEMKTLAPLQMEADVGEEETGFLLEEQWINDDETAPPMFLVELRDGSDGSVDTDDASSSSSSDNEMVAALPLERFRVKMEENAWWSGGDELQSDDGNVSGEGRKLKRHHQTSDSINVAILHTSDRVGYDILDLLLKESSEIGRLGGPKILLNSKEPNPSARTIFVWTMLSIAMAASVCCCLLVCVEYMGEEEAHAPQQPVRRRLTNNQVRDNFPAFHYHPEHHVDQPLDDECAVCLDDFEEGMRLRKLPCGHVFHSNCIARWLIERSAVCPLCKADLYEAEEEEEDETAEFANTTRQAGGALQSLTSWLGQRDQPADTTPPSRTWPWWRQSGATSTPGTTAETTTAAAAAPVAAPTPPPTRAFRWGFTVVPSTDTDQEGQEGVTTTIASTSPLAAAWRSSGNWFGRNRRRGADSNSMLTELTEPLMSSGNANEEATGSTTPTTSSEVASGDAEVTTMTTTTNGTLDHGDSAPVVSEAESSPASPPASSTPVEV